MSRHHDLKTWPVAFEAVWSGAKTFEIRLNDRFYQRGDTVTLREFDPKAECDCVRAASGFHDNTCAKYSGRFITANVGFVLANFPGRGNGRGFNAGDYVVFSLLSRETGRTRASDGLLKVAAATIVGRTLA